MPVLRAFGAALTAVFLSAVPAMAQVGSTPLQPCESQDSAPPGSTTTDAGVDGAASETSTTEGVSVAEDVTSTEENTMISPDALVFDEQLGGIPPGDCEGARSIDPPETGTGLDTSLGAVQDSADQLVEMLAIV